MTRTASAAFPLFLALVFLSSCASKPPVRRALYLTSTVQGLQIARVPKDDDPELERCPSDPSLYSTVGTQRPKRELFAVPQEEGEDVKMKFCFRNPRKGSIQSSPWVTLEASARRDLATVIWVDPAGVAVQSGLRGFSTSQEERRLFRTISYDLQGGTKVGHNTIGITFNEDVSSAAGGRYLGSRPTLERAIVFLGLLKLADGRRWMAIGAKNPDQGPCPELGCRPVPGDPNSCVRTRQTCYLPTLFEGSRATLRFDRPIPPGRHRLVLKTLFREMPAESLEIRVPTSTPRVRRMY